MVGGTILLLRGENPSRVLEGTHAKVAELNERLKADDVRIVPSLDRSNLVGATVDKVSHTIFEGVGLVIIVLILFLGSPRSAVIVGITIPFAMLVAFIFMNFTKVPANLLSIGAIDFGIIVDGAVVMAEAILRRREAQARRAAHRSRRARGRHPGRQADLLFDADHHHRLPAAVCIAARRGEVLRTHGLSGRICATRSAFPRPAACPGARLLRLSQAPTSRSTIRS